MYVCVKASSLQMMATLADSLNGTVLDLQTLVFSLLLLLELTSLCIITCVDHFEEVLQVVED